MPCGTLWFAGRQLDVFSWTLVACTRPRVRSPCNRYCIAGSHLRRRPKKKACRCACALSALWVQSDAFCYSAGVQLVDTLSNIRAGWVLIVARQRGEVWLDVVDTGIGIAPEHRSVYSTSFFSRQPGRDRSRGLGLGLSVVHRLSSLLGDPMEVHSRPGRGRSFQDSALAASIPPARRTVATVPHSQAHLQNGYCS